MVKLFNYADKNYNEIEFRKLMQRELKRYKKDSRICAVVKNVEGDRVLDVGCHVGILSRFLAEQGKEVIAIDILESVIETAKIFNQVKGVIYKQGDIFDLKFKENEFDSILFLETIEHVNNPSNFLQEYFRILKPGGSLIISTPNALSYINILQNVPFLFRKKREAFIEFLRTEPRNTGTQLDHIFSWDFKTLLRYIVRFGFEYSSHEFAGAYTFSALGGRELKFIIPILNPFLTTIVLKVNKPCIQK